MQGAAKDFNVSNIVDERPVQALTFLVLGLCFLANVSDGYNLGAVGIAAPGIVKTLGTTRAAIAPIFSAALFGMLVGALSAGYLGDRFGRKRGILITTAIIAIGTIGCAYAQTFNQLLALRFVVGVGLGGVLPNVTALMAEFMPKKVRGTFTTYAFMGITTGGTLPGLVGSQLAPGEWRPLFLVGTLIPLLVLPLVALFLPESLKFLTLHPERHGELRKWLVKLCPDLTVPANARFVLNETHVDFTFGALFQQGLKWITPTLWLGYIAIMMVNFFLNSWLPLVLTDIGFTAREAAGTTSLYYVGGICGGLIMGVALDRLGPAMLGIYALLGCVVAALIGLPGGSAQMTYLLVGLIGFSVLGAQVGMSAIAGLLYPTAMRSKGAGFAHSIGRLGAISGPLLAGVLIAKNSSFLTLFLVPVVPLSIAALCFFIITRVWTGRWRGRGLAGIRQLQQTDGPKV